MAVTDFSSLTTQELNAWYKFHVQFLDSCSRFVFILSLMACGAAIISAFLSPHAALALVGCQLFLWLVGEILRWVSGRNSQSWVDESLKRISPRHHR